MLTPGQIKEYRFQSAGQGVYRADEVDNYFQTVGEAYEKVYKDNGELIRKINMLADKVKAYQEEEELIKKTLLVAQKKADEIEASSKQRSEEVVAAAEKQASEKTASSEKRARDLLAAAEDRARKTLADANQRSADTLHGASETAEKTLNTAKGKATLLLAEAKKRAEQILNDAQEKSDSILGSLKNEVASEQKALETVRAQSKEFKKKITESYYEQIGMTSQLLGFVETEDGMAENAAKAAENAAAEKAEPVTVAEPELPEVDTSFIDLSAAPAYDAVDDDDLFTSILEETVFPEDAAEPAAAEESAAPAEPEESAPAPAAEEPAEEGGFSFVGGFGSFGDFAQDSGFDTMDDEIPEVPLAGIDDIFSSELNKEPEQEAPAFGDLREKYGSVAPAAEPAPAPQEAPVEIEKTREVDFGAFSRRMEMSLPDDEAEEPTMDPIDYSPIVPEASREPAAPAEEKPEKKKHRLSLFSKYEDDDEDEDDDDEDEDEDDDDDDEEEGGFRGFFRR